MFIFSHFFLANEEANVPLVIGILFSTTVLALCSAAGTLMYFKKYVTNFFLRSEFVPILIDSQFGLCWKVALESL